MTKPFFSIIIPTLNEEKYIERLLQDLEQQKQIEYEVIIADGGSIDATQQLVKKYTGKLPMTFLSCEAGVSRQRNCGAQLAKGEFLVFFDADVQIPVRYLHELFQQIKFNDEEVFTTYVRQDSRDVYDEVIAKLFNKIFDLSVVIDKPFIPGFNFVVSKKAFSEVGGFDESIVHAEDYDLALRLYKAGYEIVILKHPRLTFSLRRYRHEGRLSVLRKNAQAGLYVLTRGSIKKDLFSYPMGGEFYKDVKTRSKRQFAIITDKYLKKLLSVFME